MKTVINHIEKKLPWGIIGGLLGIIGLIVGIYYAVYYEKKAEVSFQIVSESDILDVRKPLKELDIYFEGEDIQKDNLNLKVIKFKVVNTGQVDILQNFYDVNEDWGFKISSGKIIEIRPTKTNSAYLEKNIKPVQVYTDFIKLKKIILEKEKYVTFEILVLHDKNSPPHIVPVGKIAGIDKIVITDSIDEKEKTSFWSDLFYGKLHMHIIRALIYFIVLLFLLISIISVITLFSSISDKLRSKKRRRKLERMTLPSGNDDSSLELIYNAYIDGRFDFLKKLNNTLKSNTDITKRIERMKLLKKHKEELGILAYVAPEENMSEHKIGIQRYPIDFEYWNEQEYLLRRERLIEYRMGIQELDNVISELVKNEKIIIQEQKAIVDDEFQNVLNMIIAVIS
ncbi:hypothetical protein [Metabacillus elymi]|uniref:Uncharacterized protein n=1 Tax=Metabacillus elymi TaxID=2745198 RepID=A0ABX6S8R3_9BACI|nr:hypothetical protein [Metabacillus sp. KUDC1714]QNF29648.1 hypothetical protein HUW50_20430 [Metabacillus sp. KUDC1714]